MDQTFPSMQEQDSTGVYAPIGDTVRLFLGWVIAWCSAVIFAGVLQWEGKIPEEIPLVQSLATSPILLRVLFCSFFGLTLHSIHRLTRGGFVFGTVAFLAWILGCLAFHMNV